jgi:hypothetical protein
MKLSSFYHHAMIGDAVEGSQDCFQLTVTVRMDCLASLDDHLNCLKRTGYYGFVAQLEADVALVIDGAPIRLPEARCIAHGLDVNTGSANTQLDQQASTLAMKALSRARALVAESPAA